MSIPGSGSPLLLATTAAAAAAAEYVIPKSLRFNSGDSAHLTRTPASDGNRRTWTWSAWVKRSKLGGYQSLFADQVAQGNDGAALYFNESDNAIIFEQYSSGGIQWKLHTTQRFRDCSAWFHLVVVFNSPASTANERMRIYVNGSEITDFAVRTNPSQNFEGSLNSAKITDIASYGTFDTSYFHGYLADIQFVDGQALAPTDFGETRSSDGVWVPKEYTRTSPNDGTVWSSGITGSALSNYPATNGFDGSISTYFYAAANQTTTFTFSPAITGTTFEIYMYGGGSFPAVTINGTNAGTATGAWVDVSSQAGGSLSTIACVGGSSSQAGFSAVRVDGVILVDNAGTYGKNGFHLNFSDSSTVEALGYDSAPTIPDPDPKKGMDVITYTGTGSTQNIGGLQFEPGLVWTKSRSLSELHILSDSVRGVPKNLYAHLTNAEDTAGYVTALNYDGFTVTGSAPAVNQNNATYVAWVWRAGGPAVANTSGTINSQVSANTDYGFSIVSYTGNGSIAQTIGHGLSSAPKWIIAKNLDSSIRWAVYHSGVGPGNSLFLNTDGTPSGGTGIWGNVNPTNSVFTVANDPEANKNGDEYIAYCWSEVSGYSKFGTYTGNGSTTGPVITTGFKPRWILVKNISSSARWIVWDTERDDDTLDKGLSPNLNSAEVTAFNANILSDGFQIVDSETTLNENNSTFIFAAFADRPGNNWDVNNIATNEGLTTSRDNFDVVTYSGNGGVQSIGGPVYSATSNLSNPANAFDGDTSTGSVFNSTGNSVLTAGSMTITSSLEIFHNRTGSDGITVNINGTNYTATGLGSNGYHTIPIPGSDLPLTTTGNITIKDNQSGAQSTVYAVRVDSNVLVDGTGPSLKFQPDFVWIKNRNGAHNHMLFDIVRGAGADLQSNSTATEGAAGSNDLTSFDSSGFGIGSNNAVNQSSRTYVAWCWKAGGTAASNTDGSVASSVSANTGYGFSVCTFTSPASGTFSFGHGLNVAPELVLVKTRGATSDWSVYHASVVDTTSKYLVLNSDAGLATYSTIWGSALPTSSVVGLTSGGAVATSQTCVAYCFANVPGYQRIGSYTGSGSSGNKIVTGFKPRFLLIKRSSTTGYWNIVDSERGGGEALHPNLSNAASSGGPWVTFSNDGFTLTTTGDGYNDSGATFIYLAIGDDEIGPDEDCLVDVPNAVTADASATDTTGGYQRGNYATLNPLVGGATLSNGNLDYTTTAKTATSTIGVTSGKYYAEVTCNDGGGAWIGIINNPNERMDSVNASTIAVIDGDGDSYDPSSTQSYTNYSGFSQGDVIGVALDATNLTVDFYKNGVKVKGYTAFTVDGPYFFAIDRSGSGTQVFSWNFGQMRFKYGLPSGYAALNTTALPAATIADGSTAFNTRIWSGDANTSRALTGLNMAPDLVWLKKRSGSFSHYLFDSIRGNTKQLKSDSTDAESTTSNKLISFDSDGFTVGNAGAVNGLGDTYVAWAWDAGTSTVSNTDGSITSSVRANPTAGFSVLTYTGTGSNATVGHGLNAVPEMFILKGRNFTDNWRIYHKDLDATAPANYYMMLESTNGRSANSTNIFNQTIPTSSVFSLGTDSAVNGSSRTMVAYCFAPVAGYSAFGSYEGNGSSDGPFVHLGFAPAFLIIKNIDSAGYNWMIMDSARDTDNPRELYLNTNTSNAEDSTSVIEVDFLSNGFKVNDTWNGFNGSGDTMIYMAFAENPFQANGGLAR